MINYWSVGLYAHFSSTWISVTWNLFCSYMCRSNCVASRGISMPISSARIPHIKSFVPTPRRWCFGSVNIMSRADIRFASAPEGETHICMVHQLSHAHAYGEEIPPTSILHTPLLQTNWLQHVFAQASSHTWLSGTSLCDPKRSDFKVRSLAAVFPEGVFAFGYIQSINGSRGDSPVCPNAANCISIRRPKSASTASERRGCSDESTEQGVRVQCN